MVRNITMNDNFGLVTITVNIFAKCSTGMETLLLLQAPEGHHYNVPPVFSSHTESNIRPIYLFVFYLSTMYTNS